MRPSWSSHNSERPGNSRRGAVRLLLVASLLFFFGWELVSTLRPAVQAQGRARGRKLRVKDRSLAGRLDRLGGRRVADYGGYLLYEVPESAAQELIGRSSVEAVDEYRFVLLNGGPIDTETSSSAHPGRAAPESFDGKRLRIVQFVGPSRPEWVTALRDTGAELVSYIPHNAYLVYADAASMGALTELESSDRVIQRIFQVQK